MWTAPAQPLGMTHTAGTEQSGDDPLGYTEVIERRRSYLNHVVAQRDNEYGVLYR
jgi:hypothetical protein